MNTNLSYTVVGIPIPQDQNYVVVSNLTIPFTPLDAAASTSSGSSGQVIWATPDKTTLSAAGGTFNLSGAPTDSGQTLTITFYGFAPTPPPTPAPRPTPLPVTPRITIPQRHPPQGTTISLDDVRQFMFDRNGNDNPLDLDLSFTEKDLQSAMRFTAMRYNAIPPQAIHVTPAHLPFGETMLNGIAYYLYVGKIQQLSRNDVDYSAGNMTIDINKRRIDFLSKLMPMFKEAFEHQAREEKITANLMNGFADVGGSCWGC